MRLFAREGARRDHATRAWPLRLGLRSPSPAPDRTSIVVEYLGDQAVLVSGADGRLYTFSPGRRSRSVPASDAERLLKNPLFRQDERRSNGTRQEGS